MATTITLSVNAQPALNDLYKVNQVINEVKMNGQSFSIGMPNQNVSPQLKIINNDVGKATKAADNLGKTASKHIFSIRRSLAAMSAEGKKAINDISKFASGMLSWWTALIVAVELATKTFTYFFTNLTESIPKLIAKMSNLVSITDKQVKAFEKDKKESDDLKKSLQTLAAKQSLTSSEQLYAQAIIEKLNKKYKDLKITIDETTGAIKGLADAEVQMNQQDRKRELNLTKRQINAQRQLANAKLAETFGTDKVSLDKAVTGRDFFTFAENTFGDLSQIDRDRLAKRWNQGGLEQKRKILEDLATDYSNNQQIVTKITGAIEALDQLIVLQQKFNDLNSAASLIIANETKQIEKNKDAEKQIADLKEKSQKAQQDLVKAQEEEYYNSLDSNEQKADYIRHKLDQLTRTADKMKEDIKKAEDKAKNSNYLKDVTTSQTNGIKKSIEANDLSLSKFRQNVNQLQKDFKKLLGKEFSIEFLSKKNQNRIKQRISQLSKQINAMNPQYGEGKAAQQKLIDQRATLQKELNLVEKIAQINLEISAVEKERTSNEQSLNQSLEIGNAAEQDRLASEKELEQFKAGQAQNELQIQEKKTQLAALQKAIAEQKLAQEQRMQDIYKDYEAQLDNINKSEEDIALETALANAQKAKGAKLTQQQIDKITQYIQKLQQLKKIQEEQAKTERVQDIFKGYEQNQSVAYLKLIGAQKEALYLEARLNAEKAKGAALTEEEYESLKGYIDMQQLIDQAVSEAGKMPQILNTGTITNELARKGGFASSVVTDRAQDINAQILKTQNKQYDVQKSIKDAVEKYSVIQ